jgi:hypothetical protein
MGKDKEQQPRPGPLECHDSESEATRPDDHSNSQDPLIGKRIGHYVVEARLGSGGFGDVYRARHETIGHHAAFKFLHESVSPKNRERFIEEGRKLALLSKHPSVIRVYDAGEFEGRFFLQMEYWGVSAEELLERSPEGLPVKEALCIVAESAKALQYIHEMQVVHMDIKPANTLIDEATGQVKIADFGIAALCHSGAAVLSGTRMGTPSYASPEQTRGKDVDYRSDIYSLGATLHELLGGGELLKRNMPQRVVALVRRATEFDPSKRFQSAKEMAAAIHRALHPSRGVLTWICVAASCAVILAAAAGLMILGAKPASGPPATPVSTALDLARQFDEVKSNATAAKTAADRIRAGTWAEGTYGNAAKLFETAQTLDGAGDLSGAMTGFHDAAILFAKAKTESSEKGEEIAGKERQNAQKERSEAESKGCTVHAKTDWDAAERYLNAAEEAWKEGDFEKARTGFMQAVASFATAKNAAAEGADITTLENQATAAKEEADAASAQQIAPALYTEAASALGTAMDAGSQLDYAATKSDLRRAETKFREATQFVFRQQAQKLAKEAEGERAKADTENVRLHAPKIWGNAEALMQAGHTAISSGQDPKSAKDSFAKSKDLYREAARVAEQWIDAHQALQEAEKRRASADSDNVRSNAKDDWAQAENSMASGKAAMEAGNYASAKSSYSRAGKCYEDALTRAKGDFETQFQGILKDKDPETRKKSFDAYAQSGTTGMTVLIRHLASANEKERGCAKEIILRIGNPALEPLLAALKDTKGEPAWQVSREQAAGLLAQTGDLRARDAFIDRLKDLNDSVRVRGACAAGLAQFKDDEAFNALIAALADQDDLVQEQAARAIGRLQNVRAVMPLIEVLKNTRENPSVRARVASALGDMGDPRAREALSEAAKESDSVLADAANTALRALRGK